jgi:sugar lactone lactonase YvrE
MGLLAPGAVVAGCRIESVVGRGGMGVVYRARELELDRVVAVKVIAPELLEDDDIRERFLREARTAAAIEHPNVIPVHAAGVRDGVAFLLMRFIEGDDARALVRRDGPLAPGHAADMAAQAAAGLDAIHRAGYVHRDVKPANVLVDRDGHVYVTDFGLAKQVFTRRGATRSGQWVGTLDYVAPEQIRGGRVDARADVYALGGVLCFMLTGKVPFERESDEAKLWAQLSEPPPVPSRERPGLPRELDQVVARAMAKEPGDRYPSAGDLGRAGLAAAAGGMPAQAERVVARGAAAPGGAGTEPGLAPEASTVTSARPADQFAPRARRRRTLGVAVAAVVALAGVGIVAAIRSGVEPGAGSSGAGASPVRVIQTIQHVGHRPNGVALAGGDLWVTSSDQPGVVRIDGETGRELAPVPRVGLGASGIASDGSDVWVTARHAGQVVRIDGGTGHVTARLRPGAPPWRLAIGLGSLWVSTKADPPGRDQLIRYDTDEKVLKRISMPHGIAAIAVGDGFVWLAEQDVPDVLRLDPRTWRFAVWAPKLPGAAPALYFGGGYLWATLESADFVVRIDPHRQGGAIPTAAGHRPEHVVAAGGRLFVTSNADHTVVIMNPRTADQEGKPLRVPHNPYAIAADTRGVWVTGLGENTLTRIAYH